MQRGPKLTSRTAALNGNQPISDGNNSRQCRCSDREASISRQNNPGMSSGWLQEGEGGGEAGEEGGW